MGRSIVQWEQTLTEKWFALRFGDVKVETHADQHFFETEVHLNDLDLKAVRVELYADGINAGAPVRQEMQCAGQPADVCLYRAGVPSTRAAGDYTVRLIPSHLGVAVPLEAARILWQR